MYLRRWAGADGKVRLTQTDTGASYLQPPKEIANRDNFYKIAAADLEAEFPGLWLEKHMARIEGDAASWLQALDDLPDGRIYDGDLIANMAVFVALQDQRTVRARERELRIEDALNRFGRAKVASLMLPFTCQLYGIPYTPQRHDELLQQMLDKPEASVERKPRAIESAIGVWRNQAVPRFTAARTWWLLSSSSPLLTCDEPVVYLGGHRWQTPSWAWPYLLYPIAPQRILVLAAPGIRLPPPYQLDDVEAAQVNFEVVAASHEFSYELPDTEIAKSISVPPMVDTDPATASTFMDAVRLPSRWREGDDQPWALRHWYSGG